MRGAVTVLAQNLPWPREKRPKLGEEFGPGKNCSARTAPCYSLLLRGSPSVTPMNEARQASVKEILPRTISGPARITV